MFNCERSEVSESSEFIYRKYRNLCIGIVDRQRIKWLEMVLFYSFYVLVFIYKVDLARSWRSLTAYISDRITSFDTNAFKDVAYSRTEVIITYVENTFLQTNYQNGFDKLPMI